MKHAIALLLLFHPSLGNTVAFAQSRETLISGRVICADDSSPLEGAVIAVKGTKNVTGTMPDGAFSIPVLQNDTVLLVSLAGYETKEIKLGKEAYYEISLKHAGGQSYELPFIIFHKQFTDYTKR